MEALVQSRTAIHSEKSRRLMLLSSFAEGLSSPRSSPSEFPLPNFIVHGDRLHAFAGPSSLRYLHMSAKRRRSSVEWDFMSVILLFQLVDQGPQEWLLQKDN